MGAGKVARGHSWWKGAKIKPKIRTSAATKIGSKFRELWMGHTSSKQATVGWYQNTSYCIRLSRDHSNPCRVSSINLAINLRCVAFNDCDLNEWAIEVKFHCSNIISIVAKRNIPLWVLVIPSANEFKNLFDQCMVSWGECCKYCVHGISCAKCCIITDF